MRDRTKLLLNVLKPNLCETLHAFWVVCRDTFVLLLGRSTISELAVYSLTWPDA